MKGAIEFSKMTGAGNDFVVLSERAWALVPEPRAVWIRRICSRRQSVGADGVLVVSSLGDSTIRVSYFNRDGSAAFCGNGSRCAARFARLEGWVDDVARLETSVGWVTARIAGERVDLEVPPPRVVRTFRTDVEGASIDGCWVDAGCPHAVIRVDDVSAAPLAVWGPSVRHASVFGDAGANVDLIQRHADGRLLVRTWERGVEAETLACGSGAIAAAMVERLEGAGGSIVVLPKGGIELTVVLEGPVAEPDRARLVGPAELVYRGSFPDRD